MKFKAGDKVKMNDQAKAQCDSVGLEPLAGTFVEYFGALDSSCDVRFKGTVFSVESRKMEHDTEHSKKAAYLGLPDREQPDPFEASFRKIAEKEIIDEMNKPCDILSDLKWKPSP